jgi:hypothetical protein
MSEPNSTEKLLANNSDSKIKKATPFQCFTGAAISGSLAYLLYLLTSSIAATFAAKPLLSGNQFVTRIAAAVRSLVVSVVSLGTFVFAIVTIGLILLAIQLLIQKAKSGLSGLKD